MKMWQRGLVVTMALAGLGGVVTPGAVVFARMKQCQRQVRQLHQFNRILI